MDNFQFGSLCIMLVMVGFLLGAAQGNRDNQTQEIIAACAAGVVK